MTVTADQIEMGAGGSEPRDRAFCEAAYAIADDVAARHAADVDAAARFPHEAVDALREARLLSGLLPTSLGGDEVSLAAAAEACYALGRRCSATAMVFAMHQIQILLISRHVGGSIWFEEYLSRVASEQRLIASVTSEKGTGGDMGRSIAALQRLDDGRLGFVKEALTVSYGAHADDYFTTLRRSPASPETDQVFVLHLGEDTTLGDEGSWDTLGMRGTCSPGFTVRAEISDEQMITDPVSVVMSETLPISFVLWSHAWLGIATAAFESAHRSVRATARRQPGETPASAAALSRLAAELSVFRGDVKSGLSDFLALDRSAMHLMPTVLRFNNLKITTAEQAPRICLGALQLLGVSGYRNDSPYSVGRNLRDALSAGLMVSNDRIHAMNSAMLTLAKVV